MMMPATAAVMVLVLTDDAMAVMVLVLTNDAALKHMMKMEPSFMK